MHLERLAKDDLLESGCHRRDCLFQLDSCDENRDLLQIQGAAVRVKFMELGTIKCSTIVAFNEVQYVKRHL